jgi:autotransporter-associated beta strand protein
MKVGSDGFGMYRKDYSIQFQKNAKLTATADLKIHQPISSDGPKDGDWGLNLNAKTFTVDTAGYTVTFDSYISKNAAKIVKEGEGELIMQSRKKEYTGGTTVNGGTLTVNHANGLSSGGISVMNDAVLAIRKGCTSGTGKVTLNGFSKLFLPDAGTGTAQIGGEFTLNDGTSLVVTNISSSVTPLTVKSISGSKAILRVEGDAPLADGEYKILSLASGNLAETASEMFISIAGSAVEHKNVSLSVSGGNLILTVSGSYATGVCEWTGGGNGVNFSDAANWKDGVKPIAGDACVISFPAAAGALVNDIQDLTPSSIVFGEQIGAISISGEKISAL